MVRTTYLRTAGAFEMVLDDLGRRADEDIRSIEEESGCAVSRKGIQNVGGCEEKVNIAVREDSKSSSR